MQRRITVIVCAAMCTPFGGCHSSGDSTVPLPGAPSGLDARPQNLTCVAPERQSSNAGSTIALERVFENIELDQPLAMLQAPGDDSRWFVLEKGTPSSAGATAHVKVFENDPSVSTAADFVTLTVNATNEGGLLGMAFHPDYATNREVFLSFTEGATMRSVVKRFIATPDGTALDPAGEDIVRVTKTRSNHNGGHIAFGPDGLLYIGLGDGGGGGDEFDQAQDTTDLAGAFLRIDVDRGDPYAIPPDNPFAGAPMCGPDTRVSAGDCPETFAWGVRNPWRWSFDSNTEILWAGDVGQNGFEEVNHIELGGNYGWDCREGLGAYSGSAGLSSPLCKTLDPSDFIDPVHQYPQGDADGRSITGGYVYRGAALPALVGSYLFGDFVTGRIWRLVDTGGGAYSVEELLDTSLAIASFGQDNDGELYVVDLGGTLHKIVDGSGGPPPPPPVATKLSATGCVSAQDPSAPAPGLIPYEVAAPFWSDGATKERWIGIPDGTTIGVGADGDFLFPNGTVLMKHFRVGSTLVETRLFMRHPDGEWAGYSYEWDAAGTDATLVQGGKTVTLSDGKPWIYPSSDDCLTCHTEVAGGSLGPETAQLNTTITYPSTGRSANQLRTLDRIAVLASPLGNPTEQPALVNPADERASLDARARAYLHTNCAQCHRPNGIAQTSMDLRYSTPLASTNACNALPQTGTLGLPNEQIIAPGAPDSSVLLGRMNRRDTLGMPPLASAAVDADGVALIREWIASLSGCR